MQAWSDFSRLNLSGQPAPSATVTVYNTGTQNLSQIYNSNSILDIKSNPFTSGLDGFAEFYAANSRYDVRFSGGGITTPWSIPDILLFDPADATSPYPLDWVNVKDPTYGATGDGVTDDTVAIQAALNAPVPANCGKVVYFPAGIYITSAPLLPLGETILLGAGKTASHIRYTPATVGANVVFVNDVARVHFRDLAIQSNGNSQICLEMYRNIEFTIINCAFVSLVAGSGTGCRIRELVNGYTGIFVGCNFENSAVGAQIGLTADGVNGETDGVCFTSCKFTSNTIGLLLDNGRGTYCSSCRFENNTTYGLTVTGTMPVSALTCVGCWFENNTTRHFLLDNTFSDACGFLNCLFAAGTGDIGTNTTNYFVGTACLTTGPIAGYGIKGINGYHRVSDGQTFGNMWFRTSRAPSTTTPTLGTTGPMAGGNTLPYAWVDCVAPDGTDCVQPIWKLNP